ncbi:phage tail protein [Nannocystis punicea]|uniref:Phage tail protein n=1 Tax=Nannocystis punicea TaxID=2995304 RepID=A0ABY7H6I6_9BACT|nr:phage tail protein [Nannocystis poenicansa]WAS94837.1 phage tail protein [Nannocystis poenicansa]
MTAEGRRRLESGDRLWSLIPRWTRAKDRENGKVLESLVRALGVGLDAVRADVLRLRDDMFVDTCAPELVPLIGDLVGETLDPRVPVDRQRYQVKQALHWRRHKGTRAQLEALVWILSGFKARVVEPPYGDVFGDPLRAARILGSGPAVVHGNARQITGKAAVDALQVIVDVVWPVQRREVVLTPLGSGVHAVRADADVGLRCGDGTAIVRSDDARALVGAGLEIEVVAADEGGPAIGRLTPRFVDLGGSMAPHVPHATLAVDPERGRIAGPTATLSALMQLRRYRLRYWEPLLAEPVTADAFHLGDGVYTFSADGGDVWLTDEQAHRLTVFAASLCRGSLRHLHGTRILMARSSSGCTAERGEAPYVVLEPGDRHEDAEAALAAGLPLDTSGLRRYFAVEDAWGWDLFPVIRLVERFSREAPADDTVEIDVRHGRFRVGPAHAGAPIRVRYYRPYDVHELRARVEEELTHAVPVGRRAQVVFRDTPVPGHTAR